MKHVEKHISRLLVSIAIFLVFGNVAFAGEGFDTKPKSLVTSEFQPDDQKPFLLHEISIGEASQTVSHNEYLGLGFVGMHFSGQDFTFADVSNLFNSSYSLKDKRELIFQYLFPFHFFW